MDHPFAPHTFTITIGAGSEEGDLVAHAEHGLFKVCVARKRPGRPAELTHGGANLRLTCPGARGSDVLGLLEDGRCGQHDVESHARPFPARRDFDFAGAA